MESRKSKTNTEHAQKTGKCQIGKKWKIDLRRPIVEKVEKRKEVGRFDMVTP